MKRWLESQLDQVRTALEPVRIVLDPDELLEPEWLGEGVEIEALDLLDDGIRGHLKEMKLHTGRHPLRCLSCRTDGPA